MNINEGFQGVKWAEMVLNQEKSMTLDKPLLITVCPTGALFARKQNPNQPYTAEEIAQDTIAAYKEGATVAHLHTRREDGDWGASHDVLKDVADMILSECPGMIIQPSSTESYVPGKTDYSYESVSALVSYFKDRKYMESTVFVPNSYAVEEMDGKIDLSIATETNTVKTVQYLQEKKIKPIFVIHNMEGIQNVREWLIKPDILEKPYVISMGPGMHNTGDTYPDPFGYKYILTMMERLPKGCVTSLSVGGRNWLPLTAFGVLLGIDDIRVGMEDHLWMYPHRDEKIKSSADEARKIANIAKELGRPIATPAQARKILGV